MSNSTEQASALNDAIADDAPEMPAPITGRVTLMRGLFSSTDEKWHTEAVVNELNGADEEYLVSFGAKKGLGYSEYMSEILKRSVVSIGDLEVASMPGIIDKLILSDRDMLFLGVTKKTYGNTKSFKISCAECGELNDIEVDLDEDFKVTEPDFDVQKPLPVETLHGEILLKLPTGESAAIAADKAKNDAEINTYMLASAVADDSLETMNDRLEWARKLSLGDRKKLVGALFDVQIGPKMGEVETQCASCDNPITIVMDWVSLLLA